MDISSIIGVVLIVVAVMGSIMLGGSITIFIDLPSIFVVGIGVLGNTFFKWPLENVKDLVKYASKSFFFTPVDIKQTIKNIKELAELARKESIFALEKAEVPDPFLAKAAKLAADNRPPEVIQKTLQLEIDSMQNRHKLGINVLDGIASDGPAFGMIGTLIGLVQMLQNLSDPSAIGPAMAVALLTTFYGSILANAVALPIKNKISHRSGLEISNMNVIIAGTLGIVAGENPRLIIEKLECFLPPALRDGDATE